METPSGNHVSVERQSASQAVLESQDEFSVVFENAPLIMIIVDSERRVRRANRTAREFAHHPPEEMIGLRGGEALRCLHSLDDPRGCGFGPFCERCAVRRTVLDTFETGKSHFGVEVEFPFLLGDKEVGLYFLVSTVPLSVSGKQMVLVCMEDVTRRKQIEVALQTSKESFHNIVERSADGIILLDREGVVQFVNSTAVFLFGRKVEELVGEVFGLPLVAGESTEIDIIRSGGEAGIGEMRVVETEWEGARATLAMIRDITERRKAEEKMKEAIRMKSEFVSTASHELRTPLTAIKEGLRLVIAEQLGELNDEQKEFLDIAKRNVDRLARLVNNILDFQKLDTGKMDIDLQENDINEVVNEVKDTMIARADEKGLNLATKIDDTMPKIRFDKDKITQVLTNIVNNAITFTEQGTITITTTNGDNIIQISVLDTGPGIKEEDLPKLFNEFEQLASGNERKTGGSGLGLAISKKIIEEHNGRIWAESEPGKGSKFTFTLPNLVVSGV